MVMVIEGMKNRTVSFPSNPKFFTLSFIKLLDKINSRKAKIGAIVPGYVGLPHFLGFNRRVHQSP